MRFITLQGSNWKSYIMPSDWKTKILLCSIILSTRYFQYEYRIFIGSYFRHTYSGSCLLHTTYSKCTYLWILKCPQSFWFLAATFLQSKIHFLNLWLWDTKLFYILYLLWLTDLYIQCVMVLLACQCLP